MQAYLFETETMRAKDDVSKRVRNRDNVQVFTRTWVVKLCLVFVLRMLAFECAFVVVYGT